MTSAAMAMVRVDMVSSSGCGAVGAPYPLIYASKASRPASEAPMADVTRACACPPMPSEPSSPTAITWALTGLLLLAVLLPIGLGRSEAAFVAQLDEPRLGVQQRRRASTPSRSR